MTEIDIEKDQSTEIDEETKEPSMYKVLIVNDDYTPMEFVVMVLQHVFNKSAEEANMIMMTAHKNGTGLAGVYSHDVAETKINVTHSLASEAGFPFKVFMEEV